MLFCHGWRIVETPRNVFDWLVVQFNKTVLTFIY